MNGHRFIIYGVLFIHAFITKFDIVPWLVE